MLYSATLNPSRSRLQTTRIVGPGPQSSTQGGVAEKKSLDNSTYAIANVKMRTSSVAVTRGKNRSRERLASSRLYVSASCMGDELGEVSGGGHLPPSGSTGTMQKTWRVKRQRETNEETTLICQ